MFSKILVPLDGSSYATHALETAIELARKHGSQIYLLHVIRPWGLPREILDMIQAGEVQESRLEIMQNSAEIILEDAQTRMHEAGLQPAAAEYLTGDPATTIARYAEEKQIALIVIGHRGLTPRGDLLGSVARNLLNTTDISCLVVS
ncbi:MAG: universal stress protein [Caldilineae bacterium]|nr:MAG: universal stress protein [Caldilineae bacterium]